MLELRKKLKIPFSVVKKSRESIDEPRLYQGDLSEDLDPVAVRIRIGNANIGCDMNVYVNGVAIRPELFSKRVDTGRNELILEIFITECPGLKEENEFRFEFLETAACCPDEPVIENMELYENA